MEAPSSRKGGARTEGAGRDPGMVWKREEKGQEGRRWEGGWEEKGSRTNRVQPPPPPGALGAL